MITAFIALGANLGSPLQALRRVAIQIEQLGTVKAKSRLYLTKPVGVTEAQPDYLNAVMQIETSFSAPELLQKLHEIEHLAGRVRNKRWEARILDLDLILYGEHISEFSPILPHPRAFERAFVLVPLVDIAPEIVNPLTKQTASEALNKLDTAGIDVFLETW